MRKLNIKEILKKFKNVHGDKYNLINNEINFEQQKIFDGCKDKRKLSFDFYLPEYNICIEYDGIQHYESIEYWGGHKNFNYIKKHDQIKTDFCENNNIKLIRIKYNRKLNSNDILEKINNII